MIEGIVLMRKYEKSLVTAELVEKKLEEIQTSGILPKGMNIRVFNQRTDLVHVTTHNVLHNLVVGMILVVGDPVRLPGRPGQLVIVAIMIPLALLFSVTVLYLQGKSANLLSIGAVDFGIIVDSSVIIVENIYPAHHGARVGPEPAADRPDRRRLAGDRAGPVLLDVDHRLRVHPPVRDDRPRRGAVRADGQHLRLRDLRGPAPGGLAGPGPLLVPVPQQDGGEGHDR